MLCLDVPCLLHVLLLPGTLMMEERTIPANTHSPLLCLWQTLPINHSTFPPENYAYSHYQLIAEQACKIKKIFCLYQVKRDMLRRALECQHHCILSQKPLQLSKSCLPKGWNRRTSWLCFSTQQFGLKICLQVFECAETNKLNEFPFFLNRTRVL